MIVVKSASEIELMRRAGRIVAEVLDTLEEEVRPGVSTAELDEQAERIIRSRGAVPSFKGYKGFPATICASMNDELVHGIPSAERRLADGDIFSVDVGAIYEGYHGDSARTFAVGTVSAEASRLLQTTQEALQAGIAQAVMGHTFGDVAAAIQAVVEAAGFSVVREYTGHGIGRSMHEPPQILHYVNRGDAVQRRRLRVGMTFALEPMVNAGGWRTKVLGDGWTVVTQDGALSAHFEHTVAVTEHGEAEILTRSQSV